MINVNPAIDNFSSLTKSRKLFEFVSNFEICILIMIVYFTCLSVVPPTNIVRVFEKKNVMKDRREL